MTRCLRSHAWSIGSVLAVLLLLESPARSQDAIIKCSNSIGASRLVTKSWIGYYASLFCNVVSLRTGRIVPAGGVTTCTAATLWNGTKVVSAQGPYCSRAASFVSGLYTSARSSESYKAYSQAVVITPVPPGAAPYPVMIGGRCNYHELPDRRLRVSCLKSKKVSPVIASTNETDSVTLSMAAYCGDEYVNPEYEQCDPPGSTCGDGSQCSSECTCGCGNCDDGNQCTDDSCSPSGFCTHHLAARCLSPWLTYLLEDDSCTGGGADDGPECDNRLVR